MVRLSGSIVIGLAMVMVFVAVLPIMVRPLLTWVFGLGLSLVTSHKSESILLQLANLLTTELTCLGLFIRASALFLHFGLPFTVFGLVLTSLTGLLVFPATVVSSGSTLSPPVPNSIISVSSSTLAVIPFTISLLGCIFSLSLSGDWLSRLIELFYRDRFGLDYHIRNCYRCGLLHLFNFLLILHFRNRLNIKLSHYYWLSILHGL